MTDRAAPGCPPATIGCPRPLSGHERALPLKVKPRTMLIQLGDWSRPRLLHTHQDGPRAGACSILARMFTATLGGQLASRRPPWSWTKVVQMFRSAPDDCRMSWTAQTERRWHSTTGQRPASLACQAHSRMRIRRRKRCQGRYPAIGWPECE